MCVNSTNFLSWGKGANQCSFPFLGINCLPRSKVHSLPEYPLRFHETDTTSKLPSYARVAAYVRTFIPPFIAEYFLQ